MANARRFKQLAALMGALAVLCCLFAGMAESGETASSLAIEFTVQPA